MLHRCVLFNNKPPSVLDTSHRLIIDIGSDTVLPCVLSAQHATVFKLNTSILAR